MSRALLGAVLVLFIFCQWYLGNLDGLLDYIAITFDRLLQPSQLTDFFTLACGILVAAIPFVLLGVGISVALQYFLPTEKIIKKLPKNIFLRRGILSCLGILLPVCECGNVPVARGLIAKGISAQEAIIFLLAAPSVNIITFIVTLEVFQGYSMAVARIVFTIIIANIIALLISRTVAPHRIIGEKFAAYCHHHEHNSSSVSSALSLFQSEFWLVTRLLIIGALIAAAVQLFIPREVITSIGANPALAVVAMLILAFVVSICSSVDSFFATAYVTMFGLGPVLAFLLAGPMIDIKMITLLRSTFSTRTILILTVGVAVLSFIVGVLCSYVW